MCKLSCFSLQATDQFPYQRFELAGIFGKVTVVHVGLSSCDPKQHVGHESPDLECTYTVEVIA